MQRCLNTCTVTNSNQQTQSYKFTSHIAAFLSSVLITEMLEICIQISYDQNVQLILKSYLPVVYGTTLNNIFFLQILLQDKYNIGVLTVNIEFMWLGTKRLERLAKSSSFPRF